MRPGGLATRLAAARRAAGLSGKQLAERLRWGAPKVSRLENGKQKPSAQDVRDWAQVCGLDDTATAELLGMLADADAEHSQWRHRLRSGGAIRMQAELDALVRNAKMIRNFEMFAVPGLIQTPAYAQAMQARATRFNDAGQDDIDAAVAARMRRQEVLYEAGREFEFILLSYVLQPLLVPNDMMLGQLDKLLSVSGLPNVSLGIVPAGVLPAVPQEGVLVADDVVIYETSAAEVRVAGSEAQLFLRRLNEFSAGAAHGDDARALLLEAAETIRKSKKA